MYGKKIWVLKSPNVLPFIFFIYQTRCVQAVKAPPRVLPALLRLCTALKHKACGSTAMKEVIFYSTAVTG